MDRLKVCEAEGVEIRKEGFYSREMVQIWFKVLQWKWTMEETFWGDLERGEKDRFRGRGEEEEQSLGI